MDYFRFYVGDYLADTQDLTMLEDGAYGRLLVYYYAKERPLPGELSKVYNIARASKAPDRSAVRSVLEQHFELQADGMYHNTRADKELGVAVPKIEKLREVARENGKKSKGRPKKPNPVQDNQNGLEGETGSGSNAKPGPVSTRDVGQPPAASHQPSSNPPFGERFPGGSTTQGTPHEPLALADARIDPDTPAAHLATVCVVNGIRATAFHPLVLDWIRDGVTVERLKAAIATARMRKGEEQIPMAYLAAILRDDSKPAPRLWKGDDAEAEALCRRLGIAGAKVNESREVWHQRIENALMHQARAKVA